MNELEALVNIDIETSAAKDEPAETGPSVLLRWKVLSSMAFQGSWAIRLSPFAQ